MVKYVREGGLNLKEFLGCERRFGKFIEFVFSTLSGQEYLKNFEKSNTLVALFSGHIQVAVSEKYFFGANCFVHRTGDPPIHINFRKNADVGAIKKVKNGFSMLCFATTLLVEWRELRLITKFK